MSDLEDKVIAEAAKIIAKELKINTEELTVLTANILANRMMESVSMRMDKDLMVRNVRNKAIELMAERFNQETELA